MTNTNAIINFAYFCTNFPHDFIDKIWSYDDSMKNHLNNKFKEIYDKNGGPTHGNIIQFMLDLSLPNQTILINWVNENYTAFDHLKSTKEIYDEKIVAILHHLFINKYNDISFFDMEYSDIESFRSNITLVDSYKVDLSDLEYDVFIFKIDQGEGFIGVYSKNINFTKN